jgi:hypothetical protein
MRPGCARCSAPELIAPRRLARFALLVSWWTLAACSAEHAEVGSDWPPSSDAGDSDWPPSSDAGDSESTLVDRTVAPGEAGVDSAEGGVGRCDPLAPIRLYYWNLSATSISTDINYIVKVENATAAALPLGALEVRYYFTNELAAPFTTDIFYTDTCCSNKITDFNDKVVATLQPTAARPNANAYLRIGFASSLGSLAVGDAVQVELGFHDPGYGRNLTQANDYSYGMAAAGTQSQWNDCPGAQCDAKFTSCNITVHRDGVLVWGTPP